MFKFFYFFVIFITTQSLYAQEGYLDTDTLLQFKKVEVVDSIDEDRKDELKTSTLETLGDYLKKEQFLKSATFGPGVGRPVIKGLDGYRVGITNGAITHNDLSAMSHDHAVAMMPKTTQRIELIKGPSTLLYGNNSAGVIQNFGEEHTNGLIDKLNFSLESVGGTNGSGLLYGGKFGYGDNQQSVFITSYISDAANYQDGNGNTIKDSDTYSEQTHIVLGTKLYKNHILKAYFDILNKQYGIPNITDKRTWIDMDQSRYGLVLHSNNIFGNDYLQSEIQYSDYLHTEFEGKSDDGLFAQKVFSIGNNAKFYNDNSLIETTIQFSNSEQKVCHEHDRCSEFTMAQRTSIVDGVSLQQNIDRFGIRYSHGHPMPNIDEQLIKLGVAAKYTLSDSYDIDISARTEIRNMKIDSSNIQEEWLVTKQIEDGFYNGRDDSTLSASIGFYTYLELFRIESSISYIERLPAGNELYWNGFHHATNSYILGDINLDNERSKNFDISLVYDNVDFVSKVSGYYYYFDNYLFQNPIPNVKDPFHNTEVWKMEGKVAKLYGVSLNQSYLQHKKSLDLEHEIKIEMIRGELENGDNIPRISPDTLTLNSVAKFKRYGVKLEYQYTDKSRNLAPNESSTPSYYTLNGAIEYNNKTSQLNYKLFTKVQNITNQQIYNHISFLKSTAPLAGRQLSFGIKVNF